VSPIHLHSGFIIDFFRVLLVTTGEEEEDTVHQVRGKLFSLADDTQWKERGTGTLKLNVRRSDGNGARLGIFFSFVIVAIRLKCVAVMRKEAVYTLLLNVTLFPGMRCTLAQDPRFVRFSVIENGTTTHYNLKVNCDCSLDRMV
jgi:Ran-binding protein 3